MQVGVLALQGDFAKHLAVLQKLSVKGVEVRKPQDLEGCEGLIIPGGESTTLFRSIDKVNLKEPILAFSRSKPIFGTCAGLILMSKKILLDKHIPFGILDVEVERNAFGRQADSFTTTLDLSLDQKRKKQVPAFFIRAPRICSIGSDVETLATFEGEPVLIRQGHHLGATFHPELTEDSTIHSYFLDLMKG